MVVSDVDGVPTPTLEWIFRDADAFAQLTKGSYRHTRCGSRSGRRSLTARRQPSAALSCRRAGADRRDGRDNRASAPHPAIRSAAGETSRSARAARQPRSTLERFGVVRLRSAWRDGCIPPAQRVLFAIRVIDAPPRARRTT